MAISETLLEVKSIHGYAAVVTLGVAFTAVGFLSHVQLVIVTLFFGFVALIDSLEDLARSIDRVDGQLTHVTDQLDRANDNGQGQNQDQPRDRDQDPDR